MPVLLYVMLVLLLDAAGLVPMAAEHAAHCIESERMALLEFKKHINDPNNKLASWVMGPADCCSWEGVHCDNLTGNVIGLELRDHDLQQRGEISPSLLQLQHLNHLDLSGNDFSGTGIPSFIGEFKELRYLDLSYSYFHGPIPASFGNLSSLLTLDLSENVLFISDPAGHEWLSHLTSLQHIYMGCVTFGGNSSSSSLFLVLNKLPALKEISLSRCQLESIPLSIPHLNFSTLSVLDLSNNHIDFSVSPWVFNLKSLEHLDLSHNHIRSGDSSSTGIAESIGSLCNLEIIDLSDWHMSMGLAELIFTGCLKDSLTHLYLSDANLEGDIPDWIGDIKNLKVLDLSGNSLSGSVPSSLASLSFMEELHLSSNKLNGALPVEIGELSELVSLDLGENQMSGIISEAHFSNLKKLDKLDLTRNSLVLNVSSNWTPPFLLRELRIRSCSVGPGFPTWLQTQHKLNVLDLSKTGISRTVPDWFWNLISVNLVEMSISENQIEGMLPKFSTSIQWRTIDLSSNRFYGPLPGFLGSFISYINLSNNSFSGSISHMIAENTQVWSHNNAHLQLFLSMNNLNGTLPCSLCQIKGLLSMDISDNNLSGEVPDCWWNSSTALWDLNLSNNNLTGGIPDSISYLLQLQQLRLSHNKLSGEIPVSLKNCSQLDVLDLSYNNFTGSIPIWVGESLSRLVALILRSNTFSGHIPQEISLLEYLQILDLSHNNLSGPIPVSFGNFSAMQTLSESAFSIGGILGVGDTIVVASKGKEEEYSEHLLPYVKIMDLSNNELTGDIPEELASLYGLQSLHLAGNQLQGEIPDKLGLLQQLESLDLSRNRLFGSIPSTFSNLTSLSDFNVSYNNLSGRIPAGNQFNTFRDPSIYIGNHLCGFPLTDNCTKGGGPIPKEPSDGDEEDDEMLWIYIGSLSGFAVGFWTIWGVLIFKKKWRYAYFRYTDITCDNIYVWVVVNWARMKSKIMSNGH